jgi:hypothetical protein
MATTSNTNAKSTVTFEVREEAVGIGQSDSIAKYGIGELILGTIDFRNELKPKVNLVTESGHVKITNISEKGKKFHLKYIKNIYLGR